MVINKQTVPLSADEDINKGKTTWRNGKYVSIDEGTHMTVFIGHEQQTTTDEEGEKTTLIAFPIRAEKPVSRDALINAAEMQAYNLTTPMQVASFTASMARKFREDASDAEVLEHDKFIAWVKEELTNIGY